VISAHLKIDCNANLNGAIDDSLLSPFAENILYIQLKLVVAAKRWFRSQRSIEYLLDISFYLVSVFITGFTFNPTLQNQSINE